MTTFGTLDLAFPSQGTPQSGKGSFLTGIFPAAIINCGPVEYKL